MNSNRKTHTCMLDVGECFRYNHYIYLVIMSAPMRGNYTVATVTANGTNIIFIGNEEIYLISQKIFLRFEQQKNPHTFAERL